MAVDWVGRGLHFHRVLIQVTGKTGRAGASPEGTGRHSLSEAILWHFQPLPLVEALSFPEELIL